MVIKFETYFFPVHLYLQVNLGFKPITLHRPITLLRLIITIKNNPRSSYLFIYLVLSTVRLCMFFMCDSFSVAERNYRSRASATRSAGHSLHPEQSHSAVRNHELTPLLHDRRQDRQWQNRHLEDLTEYPEHHASQRRTWLQPRPCESWGRLHFANRFKIQVVLQPISNYSVLQKFRSVLNLHCSSFSDLHQLISNNDTLTKKAKYLTHEHTQSICSLAEHQTTRNNTLYTFTLEKS